MNELPIINGQPFELNDPNRSEWELRYFCKYGGTRTVRLLCSYLRLSQNFDSAESLRPYKEQNGALANGWQV